MGDVDALMTDLGVVVDVKIKTDSKNGRDGRDEKNIEVVIDDFGGFHNMVWWWGGKITINVF